MKFSKNIQHHIQYTWKSLFRSIKPLICNICTNLFLKYVFHVLLIWVALFWKPFILHLSDCPTRRGKPNQIYWFSPGNLLVFSNQCFHKLPRHSLICAATPSTSFWVLPFVLSVLMSSRKILGKSQTTAHNVSIMTIEKKEEFGVITMNTSGRLIFAQLKPILFYLKATFLLLSDSDSHTLSLSSNSTLYRLSATSVSLQ